MKKITFIIFSLILLVSCENTLNIDPLNVVADHTDPSYYMGNDGGITLSITGGVPPYNITVNGKATGEYISQVSPGYYIIVVTDNSGKSMTVSVNVKSPTLKSSLLGGWATAFRSYLYFYSDGQFKEYDLNDWLIGAGYFDTNDGDGKFSLHYQSSGSTSVFTHVHFMRANAFMAQDSQGVNDVFARRSK